LYQKYLRESKRPLKDINHGFLMDLFRKMKYLPSIHQTTSYFPRDESCKDENWCYVQGYKIDGVCNHESPWKCQYLNWIAKPYEEEISETNQKLEKERI
jgi:hypothetical protein